ncbi:MAG: hypothetical protein FT726_16555 [Pantoea sp. Morm]|jgi:hypothetical protein|uniref:hypothetical protein n=1 Tax=Pantoea sp. Morm TaxID=2601250 RepID=UPI001D54710F|nr:hypothetical protein [Pantoea sp. Morm]
MPRHPVLQHTAPDVISLFSRIKPGLSEHFTDFIQQLPEGNFSGKLPHVFSVTGRPGCPGGKAHEAPVLPQLTNYHHINANLQACADVVLVAGAEDTFQLRPRVLVHPAEILIAIPHHALIYSGTHQQRKLCFFVFRHTFSEELIKNPQAAVHAGHDLK